jgi:hypothetical protein
MRKFEICDSGIPEVGLFPGEDCGGVYAMEKHYIKIGPRHKENAFAGKVRLENLTIR